MRKLVLQRDPCCEVAIRMLVEDGRERPIERELPRLYELQDRDRGEQLADWSDAQLGIDGHRNASLAIGEAVSTLDQHLIVLRQMNDSGE